jgi:hypothetical protein
MNVMEDPGIAALLACALIITGAELWMKYPF